MEKFLTDKYGETNGKDIFRQTNERIEKLLSESKLATSENRRKTLKNTILPRIALYEVLQERGMNKEEAYEVVHDYLLNVVCAKSKKQYKNMEKIPGFFAIFKRMFSKITVNSDLWTSNLKESNKNCFEVDITKCLWHDACNEAGSLEVCRLFCGCDDENYGDLKKIVFLRKGSLGRGNEMCDFKFVKRK